MRRHSPPKSLLSWAVLLLPLATGCVQAKPPAEQGPIDLASFAVSDFFTPSGHMGDGQEPGHVSMVAGVDGCRSGKLRGARGSCYRFTYGPPADKLWAGVFWAFPANNWGAEPGRLFRPWVFDEDEGVIRQRYNRIRFSAAARRDTFEVSVRTALEVDGTTRCYTLRDAVFEISGTTSARVDSNETLADSPEPDMFTPCPEAKARIVLPPGSYEVRLRDGFSVRVDDASASEATPREEELRFRLNAGTSTAETFELEVDGESVPFELRTPPVNVVFFAGGIRDDRLEKIRCPAEGEGCRYTDNVLTGGPKSVSVNLERSFDQIEIPSSVLRFEPPCVQNWKGEAPLRDDVESTVVCPDGTWTTDGMVATCPLGLLGAMQENGRIVCCDGGNPALGEGGEFNCGTIDSRDPDTGEFVSKPRPVFRGVWRHVEDIEGTLLGAFGWSTSYAEFETEPGSGKLVLPADEVPETHVIVDNIVWDYARQELE
jgi:hypothetical protein